MATQKEILIIGGGLGGISAAISLAQSGYQVSLYEKNNHLPDVKWLYFLGNISFSLYLTHIIIIKIIRKHEINLGLDALPAFLFAVTLSVATATLVYYLIETTSISACRSLLNNLRANKEIKTLG